MHAAVMHGFERRKVRSLTVRESWQHNLTAMYKAGRDDLHHGLIDAQHLHCRLQSNPNLKSLHCRTGTMGTF